MDLELKKNRINESVPIANVTARQSLDVQISLPDYCTDIKRILKCTVEPGIGSVSFKGEKISAAGGITVRLIYVGEDDKIDCYETQSDLSVSSEIKNPPENAVVLASVKTDYINCRAMSQRRVSVSGNIAVSFSVCGEKSRELLCECSGMGMQTKKTAIKAQTLTCQGEKSFEMSETVSLDNDKPDIGKIVCAEGYCIIDSKKAVTGKLLIKGELCCDIVYCVDKEGNKLCKIRHSMPVNQIIDLAGIDDKSDCTVKTKLCRLMVNAKADSSGKNRLLEIAARVSAFVKCSAVKEFEAVDDCYSTDYEIKAKYESRDYICPAVKINEEKEVRKTLDFQKGVKEILHIWAPESVAKVGIDGEKAKIMCSALLCLLYTDEKGVPAYAEKSLDLEYEEKIQGKHEKLTGEANCFVKNISCTVNGKDTAEVTADIKVDGEICSVTSRKLCKDVIVDETAPKNSNAPALTVYFSQKGEKLWDIARRYNTTVKAVKDENTLSGDMISEAKMLMIPCV